ncbi:GntR family transcriptional regulator [Gymnodinialimonas hymeniacidonis]|uniref:GntR family transcriptional regulator n=1 Tax=Gymnodinialimonas hymeniacidonis TaxID=3126508 RepID=UPI0034C69BA7
MKAPIRELADLAPLPLPRGRVADLVEDLRAEIVTGAIAPGATLVQEDLASRFGVSRMPVREAIKHLQMLGFVTVEDNKRARVAELSRADFVEIYDMREAAEALAMRSAIPHLTNAHIDEAADIQDRIEGVDPKGFGALNMAFHMVLYRPSGRTRLLAHVEMLFNAADRYVSMVSAGPELKAKANAEHRALLEHCLARDTDAAEACVRTHIADARDALVQFF